VSYLSEVVLLFRHNPLILCCEFKIFDLLLNRQVTLQQSFRGGRDWKGLVNSLWQS